MSDCKTEFAGNLTQACSHTQSSDLTTLITKQQENYAFLFRLMKTEIFNRRPFKLFFSSLNNCCIFLY